jgi:phage tail sheath protein FI
MAEKIVSPGVFTRENDLSFVAQGIGEIGAAIIGPFHKGPAFVPTIVNTQSEFEEIFGVPNGDYYTGYTVQNYLREAGTVTIVRVGNVGGYTEVGPQAILTSGSSGKKLVSSLFGTHNGDGTSNDGTTLEASGPDNSEFTITISGSSAISASTNPSAGNDISDVFGTDSRGPKNVYAYNYFENFATQEDSSLVSGTEVITLADQAFTNDIQHASTPWIQSQLISGERHDLFRFHTLGDGTIYNGEYKIIIFNVKAAGSSNATDYATFSVGIRKGSDTNKRPSVLETFNNVNLDPASPNYIKKVIGDRNLTIDANGKQTENGDYPNYSKFIRVECKEEGSFPIVAGPFGHDKYYNPILVGDEGSHGYGESIVPAVIFSTGSDENSSSKSTLYSGIDLDTAVVKIDNSHYQAPIPSSATQGANTIFAFDGTVTIQGGTKAFGYSLTGSNAGDINKRQFIVGFQGGFDGVTPTRKSAKYGDGDFGAGNSQGFDLSTSTASGSVAYVKAINAVSNPDDFDINLVSAPGVIRRLHSYVFDKVVDMVEAREDAFFIGDVTSGEDTITQAITQGEAVDSNYVGTYYPWVKTIDRNTNKITTIPPSVLMPGIYAANDAVAAEWFAPAGLNRGGIVGAISVLNRLTHAERDTLYEGKINPIAQFPGEGIVAFGQKTLQDKASALDRINVRRLLIKVKKYIASTSRYLVFEQNTSQTRGRFLNTVNPYLEGIQQRQGLYAFRVVMDETNNTPDVIDRNIMAGQIFLQPTKTAEFIVLDFNILPTGASFSA